VVSSLATFTRASNFKPKDPGLDVGDILLEQGGIPSHARQFVSTHGDARHHLWAGGSCAVRWIFFSWRKAALLKHASGGYREDRERNERFDHPLALQCNIVAGAIVRDPR
jgi:hypothetical protein